MITAFVAVGELHGVHVIHQKGLKIRAIGLCTIDGDAGSGVYQVPGWVFDGKRPKWGEIPVCTKCVRIVAAMQEPPK